MDFGRWLMGSHVHCFDLLHRVVSDFNRYTSVYEPLCSRFMLLIPWFMYKHQLLFLLVLSGDKMNVFSRNVTRCRMSTKGSHLFLSSWMEAFGASDAKGYLLVAIATTIKKKY